ncbi:MAG: tetratricopeptide repeat protein [Candidatus Adiutrix sp.]|jgi:Flp pilus assembly protein TadD|nr:tetratricopeptide repeat protein [Candidatus Adiutrix sp.]
MRIRIPWLLAGLCFLLPGCAAAKLPDKPAVEELSRSMDSWETNMIIIRAAEKSGNLDIALGTAKAEIAQRPDNQEGRLVLARLQTRTGQPEQAMITLESCARPGESSVLLEKARAGLALGLVPEAVEMLQRSKEADPPHSLIWEIDKLSAVAADLSGDHDSAQNLYRALLGRQDDPGLRYNYGRSLISSGRYGQAVNILLPLVERVDMPQARVAAAAAMAKNKDVEGARNLLHGYMTDEDINRVLKGKKI